MKDVALPLFDHEDTADVQEAGRKLMQAAEDLIKLKAQVKPQRARRPSDELSPDEVAFINALDRLDEADGYA